MHKRSLQEALFLILIDWFQNPNPNQIAGMLRQLSQSPHTEKARSMVLYFQQTSSLDGSLRFWDYEKGQQTHK